MEEVYNYIVLGIAILKYMTIILYRRYIDIIIYFLMYIFKNDDRFIKYLFSVYFYFSFLQNNMACFNLFGPTSYRISLFKI